MRRLIRGSVTRYGREPATARGIFKITMNPIEIETGDNPLGSVIWLHGLGADGHDFESIVPQLGLPSNLPLRFVFPHAPQRPITINGGMVMRGWYDIVDLDDLDSRADAQGVQESAQIVTQLIASEVDAHGIAESKIVLAGFSQGGVIALHTGLRHPRRLAGIMALSTYLTMADKLKSEASDANRDLPIFMAHGTHDPVIPIALAEKSREVLTELGWQPEWEAYPMPHAVHPDEINKIGLWLRRVLQD